MKTRLASSDALYTLREIALYCTVLREALQVVVEIDAYAPLVTEDPLDLVERAEVLVERDCELFASLIRAFLVSRVFRVSDEGLRIAFSSYRP